MWAALVGPSHPYQPLTLLNRVRSPQLMPCIHLCTRLSCPSSLPLSSIHPSPSIQHPRHLSIHPSCCTPLPSTPTYLIHPSTHPILPCTYIVYARHPVTSLHPSAVCPSTHRPASRQPLLGSWKKQRAEPQLLASLLPGAGAGLSSACARVCILSAPPTPRPYLAPLPHTRPPLALPSNV